MTRGVRKRPTGRVLPCRILRLLQTHPHRHDSRQLTTGEAGNVASESQTRHGTDNTFNWNPAKPTELVDLSSRTLIASAFLSALILLLPLVGSVSAAEPDYSLSALLTAGDDVDRSQAIAYSPDGTLLAVGYQTKVIIYNAVLRKEIESSPIFVNDMVTSLSFSSDATNTGTGFLAVGRQSSQANTPAISLYDTSFWLSRYTEEGDEITLLIDLPSQDAFSYVTELHSGGFSGRYIIEYSYDDLDAPIRRIETTHAATVNCLAFDSDRGMYITGDADGEIRITRQSDGQLETSYSEPGKAIEACEFSSDGSYGWSSVDGINLRTANHDFLQILTLGGARVSQMTFSASGSKLHLLTEISSASIQTYSTVNWMVIDVVSIGHRVSDFVLRPDQTEFAVTTYSAYVTLYSAGWSSPPGDPPSKDTDGDGIGDSVDGDRDGDGIPNAIDVNCDSNIPCNLDPDASKVRNVVVTISGNLLVVVEKIHLTQETSDALRELAAEIKQEDGHITADERTSLSNAFCANINQEEIKTTWYNRFRFDNNSLLLGSGAFAFVCDGLSNLQDGSTSRISLSWTASFELLYPISDVYNLTLSPPPALAAGTPLDMVHHFPIRLKVTDSNTKSYTIMPWEKTSSSFTLEFSTELDEERGFRITPAMMRFTALGLLTTATLVVFVLLVLRRRSRILFAADQQKEDAVTRGPPPSQRGEHEYYNPGRREGDAWNYGDDGDYYYSETYTDYQKAEDAAVKVRRVKIPSPEEAQSQGQKKLRRRLKRKNDKTNSSERTGGGSGEQGMHSSPTPENPSSEDALMQSALSKLTSTDED